jgi:hypothetical protein
MLRRPLRITSCLQYTIPYLAIKKGVVERNTVGDDLPSAHITSRIHTQTPPPPIPAAYPNIHNCQRKRETCFYLFSVEKLKSKEKKLVCCHVEPSIKWRQSSELSICYLLAPLHIALALGFFLLGIFFTSF